MQAETLDLTDDSFIDSPIPDTKQKRRRLKKRARDDKGLFFAPVTLPNSAENTVIADQRVVSQTTAKPNRRSGYTNVFKTEFRVGTKKISTELWTDKHTPTNTTGLCVHKKRVEGIYFAIRS
jgi:hypothetical protein